MRPFARSPKTQKSCFCHFLKKVAKTGPKIIFSPAAGFAKAPPNLGPDASRGGAGSTQLTLARRLVQPQRKWTQRAGQPASPSWTPEKHENFRPRFFEKFQKSAGWGGIWVSLRKNIFGLSYLAGQKSPFWPRAIFATISNCLKFCLTRVWPPCARLARALETTA